MAGLGLATSILFSACTAQKNVNAFVTTADQSMVFKPLSIPLDNGSSADANTIVLNPAVKFQEMDGFGAAITGSTCYNLLKMKPEDRTALLKETFDPVDGLGYSYIRISMGCSDFSMDEYTHCDSVGIENFAIHELDKRDLFPILKEILAINPKVKIMSSPWTPPIWMKVNNLKDLKPFPSWVDGQLNPAYYQDYATYFVKFIQAMEKEGFMIESTTIQNEPLNRGNSASLFMTWQEQRDFIKTALGPAFKAAGIKTKIVAYDHNYNYDYPDKEECADQVGYPEHIYADADAAQYIDGAAFHAYGGDKSEMLRIHTVRPDKNLYFTEISIGEWGDGYSFANDLMWNMREVGIGTINNFCKAVMVWNLMLDENHAPYRPHGCNMCLGAIDISSKDYKTMVKNSHYYAMGHLSKVIKPGAFRIETKGMQQDGVYYTAVLNPDGTYGLVLQNDTDAEVDIRVSADEQTFNCKVPSRSVSSFIW